MHDIHLQPFTTVRWAPTGDVAVITPCSGDDVATRSWMRARRSMSKPVLLEEDRIPSRHRVAPRESNAFASAAGERTTLLLRS